MILSDRTIKEEIKAGRLVVESPNNDHQQNIHASSMDLRLGYHFKIYEHSRLAILDPKNPEMGKDVTKLITLNSEDEPFIVQPGEFVLGVTLEKVKIPDNMVARVEGRSSLGRLGIIVHSTAGFIDAGFEGTITLEITNINRLPVALYPGMRVCQLAFEQMTTEADVPYHAKPSSKYQGQVLPEESRILIDPEFRTQSSIKPKQTQITTDNVKSTKVS
jgi:dCTP deaminase